MSPSLPLIHLIPRSARPTFTFYVIIAPDGKGNLDILHSANYGTGQKSEVMDILIPNAPAAIYG